MYAYCGNNPINLYDPNGEIGLFAILVVAVVVVVVVNLPSKEEHYKRNEHQEGSIPSTPEEVISSDEWEEKPDDMNIYHRHTCGEQGEDAADNKKYMSKDGKKEVIIIFSNPEKLEFVTDPYNIGTYNFGTNPISHVLRDVIPYWLWGNSEVDSSLEFAWDRIRGAQ